MPTKKTATIKKPSSKVEKVVKRAPEKKVTSKKHVASKKPCVCMKECEPAEAFWVNNGPIVLTLEGLLGALKEMTDEQYLYHTKRDGNDFANWVKDCLCDVDSAKALKRAQTRAGAIRILSQRCVC